MNWVITFALQAGLTYLLAISLRSLRKESARVCLTRIREGKNRREKNRFSPAAVGLIGYINTGSSLDRE